MPNRNDIPETIWILRQRDGDEVRHSTQTPVAEGLQTIFRAEDHERPGLAGHLMEIFYQNWRHSGSFGPEYDSSLCAEDEDEDEIDCVPSSVSFQLDPEYTERFWIAWHVITGAGDDIAAALRLETVLRMTDDQIVAKSAAAGVR